MKLKKLLTPIIAAIPTLSLLLMTCSPVHAVTTTKNVIDDSVFDNYNSMSTSQIDAFLNSFPSSCISSNKGFRAIDPNGYNPTNGYLFGSNVTAGRVINDAAKAYQINPQVLLATMQKEQSLVTGAGGCSTLGYVGAMGYGCPDGGTTHNYSSANLYTINGHTTTSVTGTCVNSKAKAGFSQQVIHGAWLLKFDRERAEGVVTWAMINGSWDNSDDLDTTYGGYMTKGTYQRCSSCAATFYDGTATIDGASVLFANGATASLYVYTPHNSGNNHFVTIYNSWFGSTFAPHFQARFSAQSASPTIVQGGAASAYFKYSNTGNMPWYDDVSAPAYHTYAVHLATTKPINRHDPFSSGWPNAARPTVTFTHVYEADGTTLAANQHIVSPGQIAEFDFNFTAPGGMKPGVYTETFQPILEGSSWWNMGGVSWLMVTVQPITFKASFSSQSAYPTIARGSTSAAFLKYKNAGNKPWYDNTSAAVYHTYAVHLATTIPINRPSAFSATWPNTARPAVTFTHVYEADGTTPAANQHIANPGQIAEFDFTLSAPNSMAVGMHREYFQPILEGSSWWNMGATSWLNITVN
ncbi:MAG TPA: hypothetical protein VLG47_02015 [Candidatus Saccharimonadales bacterium]|nr:hypothetical protein [Candidatus Saccharimonadales bacterium]